MEAYVSYFPFHGIPVTSPDNLVIHFEHHIVDRVVLLSDAGVVIDSSQYRKLSVQRSEFIRKNLVLYDIDGATQILNGMVSRFSDEAHISFDGSNLIQKIMSASRAVARSHSDDEGIQVSIDTIKDHVRVVEAGDGMVPAEETAVKALLEKETAGVEGDGESCVICMEELPRGTHAVLMPCSHVFHGACIGRWLENSHYCPVCRYQMPPVT